MNAIIAFALKQRVFLAILLPLVLIGGFALFAQLNIEAYPDPVPPLVDIVTQSSGQSAERLFLQSPRNASLELAAAHSIGQSTNGRRSIRRESV